MQEAVLTGQTDETLLARFRAGDKAAFGELYDRYSQRIFSHIFRLVANRATAEEQTQETFLRAFAQLTKGIEVRDFPAWIYRLATNLAVTHLRSRRRRGDGLDSEAIVLPDTEDPDGEQGFRSSAAAAVWEVARRLSPLQRAVLVLRYLDDQSYEQIASTLHKPVETVKVLLHKGKHRFRTELAQLMTRRPGAPYGCRERGLQIANWLAGEVKGEQATELQQHMTECSYCRETRAQLDDLRGQWLLLPPFTVPLALRDQVIQTANLHFTPVDGAMQLPQAGADHARRQIFRNGWRQLMQTPALAAVPLVIAIGLGAAITSRTIWPHFPFSSAAIAPAPGGGASGRAAAGQSPAYAFIRSGDIWLQPLGGQAKQLTKLGNVTYYRWSPDGTWLACLARQPDSKLHFDLYTVRSDGTGLRLVRPAVSTMTWSPDGKTLAVLWPQIGTVITYTVDLVQPGTGTTNTLARFTTRGWDGSTFRDNFPLIYSRLAANVGELLVWTADGILAQGAGALTEQPEGAEFLIPLTGGTGLIIDPQSGATKHYPGLLIQQAYEDSAWLDVADGVHAVTTLYGRPNENYGFRNILEIGSKYGPTTDEVDNGRYIFAPSYDASAQRILFSVLIVTSAEPTNNRDRPFIYSYRTELWSYDLKRQKAEPILAEGSSYLGFWQPRPANPNTPSR